MGLLVLSVMVVFGFVVIAVLCDGASSYWLGLVRSMSIFAQAIITVVLHAGKRFDVGALPTSAPYM
jgi:hypothetical protein